MHLPRVFNLVVLCLCTANGASAAPIHDAAASGDVETLRALVRSGVSVNSQEHQFELTPLMAAAANGRPAAVGALIAMGASLTACNKPQFSVTTITAQFRQPEILKLLLAKGGDPNGKPCKSPVGPLHVATHSKDAESVELLLARGADPNVWGPGETGSRTPLHVAAFHGELRIVKALLARGARVDANEEKRDRMTALHLAAAKGHAEVVEVLVANGAKVDRLSAQGKTAAMYAHDNREFKVERFLASRSGSTSKPLAGQSTVVQVPPSVFEQLQKMDPNIVFFTSRTQPLRSLQALTTKGVSIWGVELFDTVGKFLEAAGLPREPIGLIPNGSFDTLFHKRPDLQLFVTYRMHGPTITTKGGGVVVEFKSTAK